jgi:hypothetical protein
MLVLRAAKHLDSGAIKERFGAKKTRFATPEELRELPGLVPGSVPPFGRPILPFDLYADAVPDPSTYLDLEYRDAPRVKLEEVRGWGRAAGQTEVRPTGG